MSTPNFSYYNTVDQIYNAEWAIHKLARLELLRASIVTLWPQGHPTRLIHVVGTSGKGSTCRFLEVGLGVAGKVGAFMSPHLFDYRERISINGEFASQEDVTWAWETRVKPHCLRLSLANADHTHTFHEVSILIALALFEKHEVAWAAMEASIGGRYDQSRALDVAAVVLTNVGSDHADRLGKERWQRVLDKAGSARPGVPFFTSDTDPDNLAVISAVCQAEGAPLHQVGQRQVRELEQTLADGAHAERRALLQAGYQTWNAALSLAVIRHCYPGVDERRVIERFTETQLLGRLWQVEEHLFADIAHNAEKISALAGELATRFPERGKIIVLGLSGHRAARQVFAALARVAKTVIVTGASFKGQDPVKVRDEIAGVMGAIPLLVISDPQQALQMAQTIRGVDDLVILTGSTYTIEQALNPDPYLRTLNSSFGWRTAVDLHAHGSLELTLPKPPPPLR
jgi:dihydrofolate synthase/folylpolyglutamate synthase